MAKVSGGPGRKEKAGLKIWWQESLQWIFVNPRVVFNVNGQWVRAGQQAIGVGEEPK